MSIPLKDFRLGISESIDIMLDAQATAFEPTPDLLGAQDNINVKLDLERHQG